MLWFWNPKASERKLRLFNCGCCRRHWHLFSESALREAVEAAEQVADGLLEYACTQPPKKISSELERVFQAVEAVEAKRWPQSAAGKVLSAYRPDYGWVWEVLAYGPDDGEYGEASNELRCQAELFRCVFGNPFRPVVFAPQWRTSDVVALARSIYESRDFSAMPILTDALMDAGCEDVELLGHCHSSGPHVRGCWVVDLVLGKQ
jgi:hypothetical protein